MCWGITCDIALEGRWRRSRANTTPLPDTGVPKTQTTSVKMGEFGVFCTRWSAFWVPRPSGRPLDGGNCTTRGYDTPATHRLRASCSAKPPLLPVWRAAEGVAARRAQGGVGVRRAWLRCLWAVAGPGPDKFRMQFPHDMNQRALKNRRISMIRLQYLKYTQGNCMRNYRDAVRTQHHTATRPRSLGSSGGSEGLAAVPVGGGGAWPRQISHAIPPRHDPTQAQKPQNINDQISKPEILSGELHAKLPRCSQDSRHTTTRPRRCGGYRREWGSGGPGCGARGRWRGLAGLRGDAPSEARGADDSRAGRRPRAHKAARHAHSAHSAHSTGPEAP